MAAGIRSPTNWELPRIRLPNDPLKQLPPRVPSQAGRRPGPARSAPEIEQESEDFGAGLSAGPEPLVEAALYDPGAGIIAEDADEYEDVAVESFADADEGLNPLLRATKARKAGSVVAAGVAARRRGLASRSNRLWRGVG